MANIILGVAGGIAAYKTVYLLRILKKAGHDVKVVMTEKASHFVGPLTFATLSGHPAYLDDFKDQEPLSHIELGKWAELYVIAPATANTIAKIAGGVADNLLVSSVLATTAKVIVFPAMNNNMYKNDATQANLKLLSSRGIYVMPPGVGTLACGDDAIGKMPEPEEIFEKIESVLAGHATINKPDLSGLRILITAGPTVEPIDSVRFISNHSSGKMGYAIADAARGMGAEVTLITGPVSLKSPVENTVKVRTAAEMLSAVYSRLISHDVLIMAAAVADYTVHSPARNKVKKSNSPLYLELTPTDDILKVVSVQKRPSQVYVGFAAETDDLHMNAMKKLSSKRLDMIVANDVSRKDIGFNSDLNEVTIIFEDGSEIPLSKRPKKAIAEVILEQILIQYKKKNHK